jgi:hypothetical protein
MTEINDKSTTQNSCLGMLGWVLGLNFIWLLMAVLTVYLGMRSYNLSANGEVVTGTVVRLVEDERDGASSFNDIFPVVEFEVDGQTYSVRSQNNYRWWNQYTRFGVGKPVEMRYDPADPQKAEINSLFDLWGEPVILGLFTLIAAVLSNAFFIFRWRAGRNGVQAIPL